MSVFEHNDYRIYLRSYLAELPKKGRGELSKIAKYLHINTTHVSQVMSGLRDFTPEQTYELSQYLGHTELEADYFSLLVQIKRASSHALKKNLEKKLKALTQQSRSLSKRIPHDRNLSDEQKSVFYSSWLYSAIHLFCSLKAAGVSLDEIASRFSLSKSKAKTIVSFLKSSGLVNEISGHYMIGTQSTHLAMESPHLLRHHTNWRLKSLQKGESLRETELMFSGQFSLSHEDFALLREQISEFLRRVSLMIKNSPAEDLACLNIDWFWIEQ